MFLVPISPASVIIVASLIYFWLQSKKVERAWDETHKYWDSVRLEDTQRKVVNAYLCKFGVKLNLREVTPHTLEQNKKTLLRIKKDFDDNTPKGVQTHAKSSYYTFPEFNF